MLSWHFFIRSVSFQFIHAAASGSMVIAFPVWMIFHYLAKALQVGVF